MNRIEQIRDIYSHAYFDNGDYRLSGSDFEFLLRIAECAENLSGRLQSLPWFKNNTKGDRVCLKKSVWDEFNYGECNDLFKALEEVDDE